MMDCVPLIANGLAPNVLVEFTFHMLPPARGTAYTFRVDDVDRSHASKSEVAVGLRSFVAGLTCSPTGVTAANEVDWPASAAIARAHNTNHTASARRPPAGRRVSCMIGRNAIALPQRCAKPASCRPAPRYRLGRRSAMSRAEDH